MAIISDKLNKILSAVFGKDVRQALHDGLDAINKETESTTSRQDYLDRKYDEQIKNMTLQDPSSAEIVDMRVAANGKTFEKAGDRLDNFDEQLEQIVKQTIYLDSIVSRHRKIGRRLYDKEKFYSLAIGDSICSGSGASEYAKNWLYTLQKKLYNITKSGSVGDYYVRNNGVGSQDVTNVIQYLAYDVEDEVAKKCYAYDYPNWIIMTGRNDCKTLSKQHFELLYRICVRNGVSASIDVFCCTEPPKLNMDTGEIEEDEFYNDFADIIRRICEEEGASLVDVNKELLYRKNVLGEDIRKYSSDGTHPNDLGHDLISTLIVNCMNNYDVKINSTYDIFENDDNKLIPQVYFTPYTLNNATIETITVGVTTTSRKEHTDTLDSIKINDGGYVDFIIPPFETYYIIPTVMMKLSTGKVQLESPIGYNTSNQVTIPNSINVNAETSFIIDATPFTWTSKPINRVRVKAIGGVVYLNNITLLTKNLISEHIEVKPYSSTGTWNKQAYIPNEYFYSSNNVGDEIVIKWFGTNITFNLANGLLCGKAEIITDDVAETVDLYHTTWYLDSYYGTKKALNLGWHITKIKIIEKNSSATDNRVGIRDIKIYSHKNNDGSIIGLVDNGINLYLDLSEFNYIRCNGDYTISNNILNTSSQNIVETAIK